MESIKKLLELLALLETLTPRLVAIIAAVKAERGMTNEDLRAQAQSWNDADRDTFHRILELPDLADPPAAGGK